MRVRNAWLPLALVIVVGCGRGVPEADLAVHLDLAAGLPSAEIRREPGRIDLGTPEARPHLGAGWSWDERAGADSAGDGSAGDGFTFVWSLGEVSELRFFLARPRPLVVRARAFPYPFTGGPPQGVEVRVNGAPAGEVELPPGPGEIRLDLPAARLQAGDNLLTFHYRRVLDPSAVGGSPEDRRLGVGWDWVEVGAGAGPAVGAGEPRADGDLLFLPWGSQVDSFALLPGGAVLAVERVGRRGGEGTLQILLAWDGEAGTAGGEEVLRTWKRGGAPWRLPLPGAGGPTRLSLRAVGEGEGGIALTGARLLVPAPAPVPESSPAEGLGAGGSGARQAGVRPNILVYLVDTLRADRLGVYGSGRGLTPRLDAFAEDALVFEQALAASSWTKPSVATLLTGLDPLVHGVEQPEDGLPGEVPLLAELFRAAGYRTGAVGTNAHITAESGFARGFEHFELLLDEPHDALAVHRRAAAWLDEIKGSGDAPFFLYLHTIDPHAPYEPPEAYRRRFAPDVSNPGIGSFDSIRALAAHRIPRTPQVEADLRALYDAEVALADDGFGQLLDLLDRRGLGGTTAVLFLSDHGEAFFEHDVNGHGWDLYNEVLHVPLLLRLPPALRAALPGREGAGRVSTLATHLDVAPTLLALAGLPLPETLRRQSSPGRNLLARVDEGSGPRVFSHQDYEGRSGASLAWGPWHLIEPLNGRFAPATELYDRGVDPGETRDLARERPVLRGTLRRLLREHLAGAEPLGATPLTLDEATRQRLEGLGYLNR